MSGFQLPFGVKPVNAVPVDYYSGPYISNTSIQDALDQAYIAIPQGIRFRTMEVRLIVNNFGLKYWFKDGTSNGDLIEFVTSPSSFYIQGGTTQSYNTISDIYRTGSLTIGTSSINPSKLYVYATQSGAFQLQDGSQGDNYILTTSGTSGVATWTSSTSPFYVQGGTTYSSDTTSNIYRTGSLNIGSGTATGGRFVVSSSGGTVSLVVTEEGSVYNRGGSNDIYNTAFGDGALIKNTVTGVSYYGKYNDAFGYNSMTSNISGYANAAFGGGALFSNDSGTFNVAFGSDALYYNTTGYQNTAVGINALSLNTTGQRNTGVGAGALTNITTGSYNTAIGVLALSSRIGTVTGEYNIAIGFQAGRAVTSGSNNILIENITNDSISTGSNNIIINPVQKSGVTTGSGNVIIGGYNGAFSATMSETIVLGSGTGNTRVFINSQGNFGLGTTSPSTKLHIYATQSGAFRLEDGTQGTGKVLISDSNGVASWTQSSAYNKTIKTITGTTYSLLASDTDVILHYTQSSTMTITIPAGLPTNYRYEGKQLGLGQIIVATGSSVSLIYAASELPKTAEKNSAFAIDWISTDTYMIYGKLALS